MINDTKTTTTTVNAILVAESIGSDVFSFMTFDFKRLLEYVFTKVRP